MSFTNSSISYSTFISQSSLLQIQDIYDEELEQQELEAQKKIFAEKFEAHYNTTSMLIQTVQESVIFKKTKKLRILKRKLRKLMRNQIIKKRGVENQGQEESFIGTTQLNQFKYYPQYEDQYYDIDENKHQDYDNSEWQPIPEPIINPDSSNISSSSTLNSTSPINLNIKINQEITKNTNINNTNNQFEGIVKKTIQQYDPNEQYQRLKDKQQ